MTKERKAEIDTAIIQGAGGTFWYKATVDLLAEIDRLRAEIGRVDAIQRAAFPEDPYETQLANWNTVEKICREALAQKCR